MIKIKMCGLSRLCDIDYVNEVKPEFAGFVFAEKSRRYVTPEKALELRRKLDGKIIPVGVFVNSDIIFVSELVKSGTIDIVQLHGTEDNQYIENLRKIVDVPIIQAFQIEKAEDIQKAENSHAEYVLLDSGKGSGKTFNHSLVKNINRPYFLAGGLTPENVRDIADRLKPYAVDASSSLETDGYKDINKMRAFADALRRKD